MKLVIFAAGLLLSTSAFAVNFSGDWQGEGRYYKDGKVVECESVNISIKQTKTYLEVKNAVIHCGTGMREYPHVKVKIKGGELFAGADKVGSLEDGTLHAEATDGLDTYTYDVALSQSGELEISEQLFTDGDASTLFEASLTKVPTNLATLALRQKFECESEWNRLSIFDYSEDHYGLLWSNKVSPDVEPESRDAVREDISGQNMTWLKFADGAMLLDSALFREEVLSSWAQVRYTNGHIENYTCIRR